MHANHYLVVGGSIRPKRRSPVIAAWVAGVGNELSEATFNVVDLLDLGLGLDDEPGIPAQDDYICATTRAWSALIQNTKGVVLVTPQYNWGYPAALKNAIDHLYREWRGKPVLIVTYGGHGGGKCGAQLREVLGGMDVKLTAAMPGLRLGRDRIQANDGEVEPDVDFDGHREEVRAALAELIGLAEAPRAAVVPG